MSIFGNVVPAGPAVIALTLLQLLQLTRDAKSFSPTVVGDITTTVVGAGRRRITTPTWSSVPCEVTTLRRLSSRSRERRGVTAVFEGAVERDDGAVSTSVVENILKDIHSRQFLFRIVVIGNGAILESTQTLSDNYSTSTSPKTGEKLVTLSSDDKSFECHLKVDRVSKISFSEKDRPLDGGGKRTMRILRFSEEGDSPMCSFILVGEGEEEKEWFRDLTIRYGYQVEI